MRTEKGFTLIEMAVVLAIIALLAAILTPVVTSYVDQARTTRAHNDVKKIAQGILFFNRDTGVFPAYNTLTLARAGATPNIDCLVSGTSTTLDAAFLGAGPWTCSSTGLLTQYLNVNSLGVTTANVAGVISYRGPYLDGLTGLDPWSNPYIVNSDNLAKTGANSVNYAFALSAGPDGVIDTTQDIARSTNFTGGADDDIVSLIR
jgi:prepilin-type N-terminal cleavage/methylation domain-containing protein